MVSLCHSHFLKWHVKYLIIQANIEYMTCLVYIEFELFTYWFIQMESQNPLDWKRPIRLSSPTFNMADPNLNQTATRTFQQSCQKSLSSLFTNQSQQALCVSTCVGLRSYSPTSLTAYFITSHRYSSCYFSPVIPPCGIRESLFQLSMPAHFISLRRPKSERITALDAALPRVS